MDNLYWMNDRNFGDALNPYLYEKITGRIPTWVSNTTHSKFLAIGSILNNARKDDIIWGTGLANTNDKIFKGLDIRAVRGPLTREVVLKHGFDCPTVYGDPALLLPRFYNPTISKKYKLGIIPHVIDYNLFTKTLPSEYTVINLQDPIEAIVDAVLECDSVISSSLHGLILADSYNIPSKWVEFSNNVLGDGIKFNDYFLSIGIPIQHPINLRKPINLDLIDIPKYDININLDALIEVCPF